MVADFCNAFFVWLVILCDVNDVIAKTGDST